MGYEVPKVDLMLFSWGKIRKLNRSLVIKHWFSTQQMNYHLTVCISNLA